MNRVYLILLCGLFLATGCSTEEDNRVDPPIETASVPGPSSLHSLSLDIDCMGTEPQPVDSLSKAYLIDYFIYFEDPMSTCAGFDLETFMEAEWPEQEEQTPCWTLINYNPQKAFMSYSRLREKGVDQYDDVHAHKDICYWIKSDGSRIIGISEENSFYPFDVHSSLLLYQIRKGELEEISDSILPKVTLADFLGGDVYADFKKEMTTGSEWMNEEMRTAMDTMSKEVIAEWFQVLDDYSQFFLYSLPEEGKDIAIGLNGDFLDLEGGMIERALVLFLNERNFDWQMKHFKWNDGNFTFES